MGRPLSPADQVGEKGEGVSKGPPVLGRVPRESIEVVERPRQIGGRRLVSQQRLNPAAERRGHRVIPLDRGGAPAGR